MLLVIPAIDLRGGRCVRLRQGRYEDEPVYFRDPVKMAKLWRVQNAKVLHLADLDAEWRTGPDGQPPPSNRALIREIATALDIPVQVGGGVHTLDDIEELIEAGVYRVVLGPEAALAPDFVEEAVGRHTASRIVVRLRAEQDGPGQDTLGLAQELVRRGVHRIVYTDLVRDGDRDALNIEGVRALAARLARCRITAAGGVRGYPDLLRLRELEPLGVDSVIVGRALYENRFPCQQIWGWHDKEQLDLDRFSTAQLARETTGEA